MKRRTIVVMSDFSDDYYHGVMKGVILKSNTSVNFVDLPVRSSYNTITSAWILLNAKEFFPDDTIFLIVVDPGVGTSRLPLVVRIKKQQFVVPDNGIMHPFENEIDEIRKIEYRNSQSTTFHGRDVFAPTVGRLIDGSSLSEVGDKISSLTELPLKIEKSSSEGYVMAIDEFGNIVTSLVVNSESDLINCQISGNNYSFRLVNTFADLDTHEIGGLIGSCGTLEIVMNQRSAANNIEDVKVGDPVIPSTPH